MNRAKGVLICKLNIDRKQGSKHFQHIQYAMHIKHPQSSIFIIYVYQLKMN